MPDIELVTELPPIVKVSEVNAQAEANKAKRALPIAPGKLVGFKDLLDWVKLLTTEEQQQRITIWIYRREPVINRQLLDPSTDNNIDVVFSGFDKLTEEYMKENHGGGNFKFIVKDADKPKTQLGGFFEAVLNIPMIDCPPKLDLREVEWDNPHNKGFKSWCRARKMIDDNNMPVITKTSEPQQQTNGVDANMLKMMLDFTKSMSDKEQAAYKQKIGGEEAVSKSMNELFLEKLKQEDPNKQMNVVVSLVTAMKQMQPEQKPDNTLATIMPMFMTMMQSMNESANRQMTLVVEMMKASKPEPKEEGSRLDELRSLMAIAKEIKGGGVTPEKTVTESLIELGTSVLPGVLAVVANITAANNAAKGMPAATPVNTGHVSNGNGQQQTKGDLMGQIQSGQIQAPAAQAVPPNEAANLITQFEPIIINKLGQPGWEFGAWVAEGFGDMTAASIAKYGPEALLQAAKGVPSFWQKIEASYGEPHLKKWLESLCNYKEIMEQMDSENEEVLPLGIKELKK